MLDQKHRAEHTYLAGSNVTHDEADAGISGGASVPMRRHSRIPAHKGAWQAIETRLAIHLSANPKILKSHVDVVPTTNTVDQCLQTSKHNLRYNKCQNEARRQKQSSALLFRLGG